MDCKDPSTLATLGAENSSSSSIKWPKFLGKGTYGKVWKIDEQNVKKVTRMFDKKNNSNIISSTLREACFLQAFRHSHICPLTRIERHPEHMEIDLIMPDSGKTLGEWVKITPMDVRLYTIPYVIVQILSVLAFLEKYGISHGDLKPWNILIDENFHVSVIDWGAVCFIPQFNPNRECTTEFAAPELMDSSVQNGCSADIFSLGLIIRYLVYGKYEDSDWILTQCSTRGFVPILKSGDLIRKQKNIELIKHFQPLLHSDPLERPKASDILNWNVLKEVRSNFHDEISKSVNYNITPIKEEDWKRFKNINLEDRKATIIQFFEAIRQSRSSLNSLPFAVELMDQYIVRRMIDDLNKKQMLFILIACFFISNSLLGNSRNHSELLSSKQNSEIFNELRETIFHIVSGMNWTIYFPIWNKEITHPDADVMIKVLTYDNMLVASQDEKLNMYKVLKSAQSLLNPTSEIIGGLKEQALPVADGKQESEKSL
jgi:serine/threonine protein kinase